MTGQRFGRLVVTDFSRLDVRGNAHWFVTCDCGKQKEVFGCALRQGTTRSCGCIQQQKAAVHGKAMLFKHGYTNSPTYHSWESMIRRCNNPNCGDDKWARYGGANPPVKVCDRWLKFVNFLEDMGERSEGTTNGRYGDIGNYEPGNCAWMTPKQQWVERKKKQAAQILQLAA